MKGLHSGDKRAIRNRLVRNGLACWYMPLKSIDEILKTNLKGVD